MNDGRMEELFAKTTHSVLLRHQQGGRLSMLQIAILSKTVSCDTSRVEDSMHQTAILSKTLSRSLITNNPRQAISNRKELPSLSPLLSQDQCSRHHSNSVLIWDRLFEVYLPGIHVHDRQTTHLAFISSNISQDSPSQSCDSLSKNYKQKRVSRDRTRT
jgi:hypothetical protein